MKGCIPAVVSSTEGSWTEGTSEAEGTILCPRSREEREVGVADLLGLHVREPKYSADRRAARAQASGDRAVADDRLALQQHRGLARRGAGELLAQLDLERRVAAAAAAAPIEAGRAREW